jgi:hypothetical protein
MQIAAAGRNALAAEDRLVSACHAIVAGTPRLRPALACASEETQCAARGPALALDSIDRRAGALPA